MVNYEQILAEIRQLSKTLMAKLEEIHADMEQNEPEQVEEILEIFQERGRLISVLQEQQQPANWTAEGLQLIKDIQEIEPIIQSRMRLLYASFSNTLKKVEQGKQASVNYQKAYENVYTDGVYFDKRK